MPRNGSGSYNLPTNSWNPAINDVSATPADWQALVNDVAAAIQASVASDGQTSMSGNLAMGGYRLTGAGAPSGAGMSLRWEQLIRGADIPSAASITIPLEGQFFAITGTTAITSIAATIPGRLVYLKFDAGIVLTNSANLIMPGGANVTTAADDIAAFLSVSSGVWKCVSYPRYVASSPLSGVSAIAAGTIDARTAALNPAITAYTDQTLYLIRIPAANATTTPTLDLGGGAKTVVKGNNLPLIAGDMVGDCVFQYNATLTKFVLINPATSAAFNTLQSQTFGVDQPWQDVTGARAIGVTYTNATLKPISVKIQGSTAAGANGTYLVYIDGELSDSTYQGTASTGIAIMFDVLPGSTYRFEVINAATVSLWKEAR